MSIDFLLFYACFFTDPWTPGTVPDGGIVAGKEVRTCFPDAFCRKWNSGVIDHEL
ncbi:MAG: hypothetical protein IKG46_05855 [Solobacterium sp.]|nr:hypothetical protein [Solobacterium sp.]